MKKFYVYLNDGSHQVIKAESYTFGSELVILSKTSDDGSGYDVATYSRGDVKGVVDSTFLVTPVKVTLNP